MVHADLQRCSSDFGGFIDLALIQFCIPDGTASQRGVILFLPIWKRVPEFQEAPDSGMYG